MSSKALSKVNSFPTLPELSRVCCLADTERATAVVAEVKVAQKFLYRFGFKKAVQGETRESHKV